MNKFKKAIAIGTTFATVLWSIGMVLPVGAVSIGNGDVVKTAASPACYYIQGSYKRVFPHEGVYFSWGYPDFSIVKTVTAAELAAYEDANPMPFRDGSLFRGSAATVAGCTYDWCQAYSVFYVKGASLKPVLSEDVYMALFKDASWSKVIKVPDDLLAKFNYPLGDRLSVTATHPDGSLVRYAGETQKYLIADGKKRAISEAAFQANKYLEKNVIEIAAGEVYTDSDAVTGSETALVTPGWSGITPVAAALAVSLSDTPAPATVPTGVTNVPLLRVRLAAGSSDVEVSGLSFKRSGVGADDDWLSLYLYEGSTRITATGRTLATDTHDVEFPAINVSIPANSSKIITLRGNMDVADNVTSGAESIFELQEVSTTATVSGLPAVGNKMIAGSAAIGTVTIAAGSPPVSPSVGAQAAEIANFTIQATGDSDVSFDQIVFTFTGTISRSEITNLKLYLLGETTALATVSGIGSNETFTMTLASPYVISKGLTKTFLLKADLAGKVGKDLTIYVDEKDHLVATDSQYGFGATITNNFDLADAAKLTLQGGEITLADNGPVAGKIGKNQQDVVLTKFAITSDRDVEVRKLYVTLTSDINVNPTDGVKDLRIKDVATGKTLMTPTVAINTANADLTVSTDYLMTGTFNLTANVVRNLGITVDVGVDTGNKVKDKYVKADLKMVDRSDDSVATGAANEEAQIRDITTGDWILTTDIIPISITGDNQTIQAPSLTLSTASTPVSDTYIKGAEGVPSLAVVFAAGEASAVSIRQIKARVYATDAASSDAINPTTLISVVKLYDGDTLLGSKSISYASGAYGTVTYDGLNVAIAAGANKKLLFKVDLLNTFTAKSNYWIGVYNHDTSADEVVAYDADGKRIALASTDAVNINGGVKITADVGGSITAAKDSGTPDSDIIIAGSSNNVVSKIKLTANDENFTVNKLTVQLVKAASSRSVTAVKIAYPGGSATGYLANVGEVQQVKFTNLDWLVEKDTSEILTISADLNTITGGAVSGDDIQFKLGNAADDFEAVAPSGIVATGADKNGDGTANDPIGTGQGNPMYLRKSKPTLTFAGADATMVDGTRSLYKFTVAADSAAAIDLKKFTFDIIVSDSAGDANSLNLVGDSFKLYDLANPSIALDTTNSTTTKLAHGEHYLGVTLADGKEVEIAASNSNSKTFELKGKVASSAQYDSIVVNLTNTYSTGNVDDANYLANSLAATNAAKRALIWSDESIGVTHAYDTADWTNGYLVKTLPLGTQTLSR